LQPFVSNRSTAAAVLLSCCLVLAAACAADHAPKAAASSDRFPQLDEREAWERMARPTPALPAWALALVDTLPQTTAAQIDLDNLHRTANPLGPALSARVRWAVADANRCAYSKAIAEGDLERAAVALAADPSGSTEVERVAVDFARKLTLSASEITDEEAAAMLAVLGPDDAVALVHTVAHANFQDRIFLALGLGPESDGPKPPSPSERSRSNRTIRSFAHPRTAAHQQTAQLTRRATLGSTKTWPNCALASSSRRPVRRASPPPTRRASRGCRAQTESAPATRAGAGSAWATSPR
jgi:hypothetical protein